MQVVAVLSRELAEFDREAPDLSRRSADLRDQQRGVERRLADVERDREDLHRKAGERAALIERLQKVCLTVGAAAPLGEATTAVGVLENDYHDKLAVRDQIASELASNRARLAGVETAQSTLESAIASLREALRVESLPADIVAAVETARVEADTELSGIDRSRGDLSAARRRIESLRGCATYLREVRDVAELEQHVPPVQRRHRQLVTASSRLKQLREAVLDVSNALTQYQEAAVAGSLDTLTGGVQELFAALGAHPEYSKLVVTPDLDKKAGTTVYRLRVEDATGMNNSFARTVLSRAELNVVALALFLSLANTARGNLGTSVMDDPSQSLDPKRTARLASVLSAIAQERQLVIATEDRLFADALQGASDTRVIRLAHTPHGGVAIQGP
jgi:DNA repair exonuclease SbcCD ATPase subunit